MEIIDTALIERIRKALIKRYDRDQQIQQMIEEIGAEEGLNETELAIVYQAYLEVKERIYYTSSLVDLWNQIEEVQKRMSMLHTYDSLEEDLFGNVLGDDKEDIIISDGSYLGKGASHNNDVYAMEQVQLSDIPVQHDSTVGMNHIKLNELHSMGGLFTGSGESSQHEISDLDEDIVEHMDVNPLDGVESLEVHHMDEENMSSIDPYTAVNALLFGKSGLDSDKANKKMEKLLKKQLKRVDDEWARINGTDDTSKKSKDLKKLKDDKKSKGDKKSKEDKKSKDDKKSKEDKKDKKDKKHKKSKEDKYSKSEDKLKKKKDKAEKKLKVLNDKLKTVFLGDTFSKKDKNKDKKKDKKSKKDGSEKKQKR